MPDQVRSVRSYTGLRCLMAVTVTVTVVGCASWVGREPRHENPIVTYYDRLASDVARLDPRVQSEQPAPSMGRERELIPPKPETRWLLSMEEAIRLAIQNNTIIRQNAQYMTSSNPIMQSPDSVPSIYDPLIQNTGVLFGQRGTSAAISDFDPRLSVTLKSGADQNVQNTTNLPPVGQVLDNNYAQMQSRIEQQLLGGGILSLNQNWNYGQSNQPLQLYNSAFTGVVGAEYRQPLWAGSGRTFTSIAGPISQKARGFSNVSQGVVISHINKRLSEIDLLENLQNLVREVGDLYWDLRQNYQDYEAEQANAQVAENLWELIKSRKNFEAGVDVAQAEDGFYEARAREELALSNLYLNEFQLRRLLAISLDDNRLIYPSDVPKEEELKLNRAMCLYEALVNRTELVRQKTNLHSLQLQLCAAKKLVAPRFDFVSGASLNGFGNNLYDSNTANFNSAISNLYTGRETSWSAGFEYSIPLWLRQEKSQVHQLEFRILKARAALTIQEDEIAHELNTVLMRIKRSHSISRIALRRMHAAHKRVIAADALTAGGLKNSDIFLRALTSYTQAKVAYSRSITEYNKYLRDLLFRLGRLLPADGVQVLGLDGLPLMSPANAAEPFDDLKKPDDGDEGPDPPRPADPNEPEEKRFPQPKKTSPIAQGDDAGQAALDIEDDLQRLLQVGTQQQVGDEPGDAELISADGSVDANGTETAPDRLPPVMNDDLSLPPTLNDR